MDVINCDQLPGTCRPWAVSRSWHRSCRPTAGT